MKIIETHREIKLKDASDRSYPRLPNGMAAHAIPLVTAAAPLPLFFVLPVMGNMNVIDPTAQIVEIAIFMFPLYLPWSS